MWKKLKNKLCEGIKKFIPIVKNFNDGKGGKWSRLLDLDIRKHIRLKSKLWKKYMATQANQNFFWIIIVSVIFLDVWLGKTWRKNKMRLH